MTSSADKSSPQVETLSNDQKSQRSNHNLWSTTSVKIESMDRDGTMPAGGGEGLNRQDASGVIVSIYHKSISSE